MYVVLATKELVNTHVFLCKMRWPVKFSCFLFLFADENSSIFRIKTEDFFLWDTKKYIIVMLLVVAVYGKNILKNETGTFSVVLDCNNKMVKFMKKFVDECWNVKNEFWKGGWSKLIYLGNWDWAGKIPFNVLYLERKKMWAWKCQLLE